MNTGNNADKLFGSLKFILEDAIIQCNVNKSVKITTPLIFGLQVLIPKILCFSFCQLRVIHNIILTEFQQ